MFDLGGKKALVTGSSSGIGFAVAKVLAEHGAYVYVHGGTDSSKTTAMASKIKNATALTVDLSEHDSAERIYSVTGDIDILVSNASIQYRKSFLEIDDYEFDKQVSVNFKSALKLIQKYTPYMKEKNWGRIVTVGSVQQQSPHKDMLVYAATKAAQHNMVINLAKQLAPFGITVNNVAPGVIETPRNDEALKNDEYREKVLSGIPCGYFGKAEDVTAQILLLCSDEGRYITGENIFIDGGMKL